MNAPLSPVLSPFVPILLSLSRPIVSSHLAHLNSPTPFNALTSNNLQPRLVFHKICLFTCYHVFLISVSSYFWCLCIMFVEQTIGRRLRPHTALANNEEGTWDESRILLAKIFLQNIDVRLLSKIWFLEILGNPRPLAIVVFKDWCSEILWSR